MPFLCAPSTDDNGAGAANSEASGNFMDVDWQEVLDIIRPPITTLTETMRTAVLSWATVGRDDIVRSWLECEPHGRLVESSRCRPLGFANVLLLPVRPIKLWLTRHLQWSSHCRTTRHWGKQVSQKPTVRQSCYNRHVRRDSCARTWGLHWTNLPGTGVWSEPVSKQVVHRHDYRTSVTWRPAPPRLPAQ